MHGARMFCDMSAIQPQMCIAFESQLHEDQDAVTDQMVLLALHDLQTLSSEGQFMETEAILGESLMNNELFEPSRPLFEQDAVSAEAAGSSTVETSATLPSVLQVSYSAADVVDSSALDMGSTQKVLFEQYAKAVQAALAPHVDVQDVQATANAIEDVLNAELEASKHETAFFIVDLGAVVRKQVQWTTLLPRVVPHYAVKCNPDVVILRALHAMGVRFDCASKGEIELALSVGATPSDIIFANPCKNVTHINFAKAQGVKRMTFDNEAELMKIAANYPGAECVLRIKPPIEQAVMSFSSKFGAGRTEARKLVKLAAKIGVDVVGVSFHVGSGCYNPEAYVETIREAYTLFELGAKLGKPMTLLDIGGGWPGSEEGVSGKTMQFAEVAAAIRPLIDELFDESVQVISEPGRFYVTESGTLAANVIARRANYAVTSADEATDKDDEKDDDTDAEKEVTSYLYYISDGVYGTFNAIIFDGMSPKPLLLNHKSTGRCREGGQEAKYKSTVFGPTCDSVDVVCRDLEVEELNVGDWLYFRNMGAYTTASGTQFNGFPLPSCRFIISHPDM